MKKLLTRLGIRSAADFKAFVLQFIKFGLVGLVNTLVNFAVYYGLLFLHVHYLLAYTAGFVVSVLNAYYWNSRVVFRKKRALWPLVKTVLVYLATFLISAATLRGMVQGLHISELVAPVINLCLTIPANFLLNKYWALK